MNSGQTVRGTSPRCALLDPAQSGRVVMDYSAGAMMQIMGGQDASDDILSAMCIRPNGRMYLLTMGADPEHAFEMAMHCPESYSLERSQALLGEALLLILERKAHLNTAFNCHGEKVMALPMLPGPRAGNEESLSITDAAALALEALKVPRGVIELRVLDGRDGEGISPAALFGGSQVAGATTEHYEGRRIDQYRLATAPYAVSALQGYKASLAHMVRLVSHAELGSVDGAAAAQRLMATLDHLSDRADDETESEAESDQNEADRQLYRDSQDPTQFDVWRGQQPQMESATFGKLQLYVTRRNYSELMPYDDWEFGDGHVYLSAMEIRTTDGVIVASCKVKGMWNPPGLEEWAVHDIDPDDPNYTQLDLDWMSAFLAYPGTDLASFAGHPWQGACPTDEDLLLVLLSDVWIAPGARDEGILPLLIECAVHVVHEVLGHVAYDPVRMAITLRSDHHPERTSDASIAWYARQFVQLGATMGARTNHNFPEYGDGYCRHERSQHYLLPIRTFTL